MNRSASVHVSSVRCSSTKTGTKELQCHVDGNDDNAGGQQIDDALLGQLVAINRSLNNDENDDGRKRMMH